MVENYQQEQTLKEPETPNYTFATIGQIYGDGMSLIFPGAEGPSEKHYKANLYCKFEAGQRVYIAKDSGTYVVLFPVGISGSKQIVSDKATTAETAGKADSANTANSANTAKTAQKANSATSANNASTANKATTADKWTTARTISFSGDASGSVSIDGSGNKTVKITVDNFRERHMGSRIAFFGGGLAQKQTVRNLSSNADLAEVRTKLNSLLTALRFYSLIG